MKEYLKDITGNQGSALEGVRVILAVTGSIAAVESTKVARALMRHGAEVFPVMSRSARDIIDPKALEWATGNPVVTEITGRVEHLQLAGEWEGAAHLLLVAPATANTLGKMAAAIDDTAVTTVATAAIGSGIPVMAAPGMHECMLRHPVVLENIEKLKSIGVEFIDPVVEEGKAKMATPERILGAVIARFSRGSLKGKRILINGGATVEHLDDVRVVTNLSSGRMACELAREAHLRGGAVTLLCGRMEVAPPAGVRVVTARESDAMRGAVLRELKSAHCDVFIAAAAVSDFRPRKRIRGKADSAGELTVTLVPTAKILDEVKRASPGTFLVAFKAEAGLSKRELVKKARARMELCLADLMVANEVGLPDRGMESGQNEVILVAPGRYEKTLPLASKEEIARGIWDAVVERLPS